MSRSWRSHRGERVQFVAYSETKFATLMDNCHFLWSKLSSKAEVQRWDTCPERTELRWIEMIWCADCWAAQRSVSKRHLYSYLRIRPQAISLSPEDSIVNINQTSDIEEKSKLQRPSIHLTQKYPFSKIHVDNGPRYVAAVVQLQPLHCAHRRDGSRKVFIEAALAIFHHVCGLAQVLCFVAFSVRDAIRKRVSGVGRFFHKPSGTP